MILKSSTSRTTIPQSVLYIGWLTAITVGIASMFSVVIFFDQSYTRLGKSLYAGLHRLGWSFSTSWIILACVLDAAGPLKPILTSRYFEWFSRSNFTVISHLLNCRVLIPFSRLTYCAYLTNGLVELYQAGTIRVPKYMSTFILLGDTLSHVMITFIGALILCLVFESPIHGIEKILLRRGTVVLLFKFTKKSFPIASNFQSKSNKKLIWAVVPVLVRFKDLLKTSYVCVYVLC